MANEITVVSGDGLENFQLLFYYPITTPATINGTAQKLVPTPSSGLPAVAAVKLSQAFKDALDAGDAAYEIVTIRKDVGFGNPQLIAKAQALYATSKASFEADYASRYRHIGAQFNAT